MMTLFIRDFPGQNERATGSTQQLVPPLSGVAFRKAATCLWRYRWKEDSAGHGVRDGAKKHAMISNNNKRLDRAVVPRCCARHPYPEGVATPGVAFKQATWQTFDPQSGESLTLGGEYARCPR